MPPFPVTGTLDSTWGAQVSKEVKTGKNRLLSKALLLNLWLMYCPKWRIGLGDLSRQTPDRFPMNTAVPFRHDTDLLHCSLYCFGR
jgi:hypothetical protein